MCVLECGPLVCFWVSSRTELKFFVAFVLNCSEEKSLISAGLSKRLSLCSD